LAHTFDNNLRFSGSTNPLTSNYTCGANAKLLVLGIVTGGSTQRSGGAPTYNGVALTQADETRQYSVNPECSCELWYLTEPDVGSAEEISIPNPSSLTLHVQASSYNVTAGYTSGLDVVGGSSGTSASPSISVTPTLDGAVIVGVLGSGEDFIPTANSGTELNTTDDGLYADANQYTLQATAGAIATSWTTQTYGAGVYGGGIYNGDDDWCMCVAAFKQTNLDVTVEPTVLALSLSLLGSSVDVDDSPTIIHTVQSLTLTLNAPTIAIDKTHEPTVLAGALTLNAPTIVVDTTITPTVLALSLSLGNASTAIEQDITVSPSTLVLTLITEHHNVLAPLDIVRMMPFVYSSDIAYPIEFGEKYARFYYGDSPLLGVGEVHVEISTDYLSSELLQIQTKQINDVMWCVHPSHPQAKLSRTTPTAFTLEDIEFKDGPFLERNDIAEDDGVTMSVNVTEVGERGTLFASSAIFESGHVGALFKLTHPRVNRKISGTKTGTQTGIIGSAIKVLGDYIFSITSPTWSGTVKLQKSTDDWVNSTDVITYTSGTRTYKATETTDDTKYRINVTSHASGTISASLVVNTSTISGTATSVGVMEVPLDIKGAFNFNTHGNWDATVALERNEDDAGWEPYRTYVSVMANGVGDRNVQYSGIEESNNVKYRINVTSYTGGTVNADLQATSSTQSGIVRINEVVSSTEANVIVVSEISQISETKRWAEGAWSAVRGYPTAIGLFEERIIYGGTENNPNRIWLSSSGSYENFEAGTKDADSFALDLPSSNSIKWIAALNALMIGTSGEEFRIRASELDTALTPTDFNIRKQTAYGSTNIQAIEVGSVVLFVDSVGRKVRELVFNEAQQQYIAPDLTALSEHITKSGITWIAHQKNPDSILWCGLDNGNAISLSYEREQNVVAWANHPTDGLVQSGAVIPSTSEDKIWFSIVRAIGGDNKVYIEQLQSRYLDIRKENSFFVDSGIVYNGALATVITGLDHLEGKIVAILADGKVLSQQRVEDGEVTLSTAARNVRCGLPYTSKAIPMRMDMNFATGTTSGSIKKISEIALSFHDTLNAKYGYSDTELFDIDWDNVRWENSSNIKGLFTGSIVVIGDGGFGIEDTFVISQSDPLPCTVRAMIPRIEKTGR